MTVGLKQLLTFNQVMQLYNHIAEEERHFNSLELEYRKLASQWLLVSLTAIGFVLGKDNEIPINNWRLVIAICLATSIGILILWLLDMKVYHELLHSAFKAGVHLENQYPEMLPRIRNNMVQSQSGGDIIRRVILFYYFSVLTLIIIANISVWMLQPKVEWLPVGLNLISSISAVIIYKTMTYKSSRNLNELIGEASGA